MTDDHAQRLHVEHERRIELVREAVVMVLYVSIVVLSALTVIPSDFAVTGDGEDHRHVLLGVVWGTSIGIALAHWFAFELAIVGFHGGKVLRHDIRVGWAQLGGAAFVASATTLPILFSSPEGAVRAAAFVPAALIGVGGYLAARSAERSRLAAVGAGIIALVLGLTVASIKAWLTTH